MDQLQQMQFVLRRRAYVDLATLYGHVAYGTYSIRGIRTYVPPARTPKVPVWNTEELTFKSVRRARPRVSGTRHVC